MNAWTLLAPIWFEHIVVLGNVCSDAGCYAVARWIAYWPGQTRCKCTAHRDAWSRVAAMMGFELVSTPLSVRELEERDPSVLRFEMMELDR